MQLLRQSASKSGAATTTPAPPPAPLNEDVVWTLVERLTGIWDKDSVGFVLIVRFGGTSTGCRR